MPASSVFFPLATEQMAKLWFKAFNSPFLAHRDILGCPRECGGPPAQVSVLRLSGGLLKPQPLSSIPPHRLAPFHRPGRSVLAPLPRPWMWPLPWSLPPGASLIHLSTHLLTFIEHLPCARYSRRPRGCSSEGRDEQIPVLYSACNRLPFGSLSTAIYQIFFQALCSAV